MTMSNRSFVALRNSPASARARDENPSRAIFLKVRPTASGSMSTPRPDAFGNSPRSAQSSAPEPQPRSTILSGASLRRLDSTASISVSLSARGTRIPGATSNSSDQNSRRPTIWATDSSFARRETMETNRASSASLAERDPSAISWASSTPNAAFARTRASIIGVGERVNSAAAQRISASMRGGRGGSRIRLQRREAIGLILRSQRIDELAERVAAHHIAQIVQCQIDAVIGDAALREVIGADALRPVAGADHALARRRPFGVHARPLGVIQPGAQDQHRLGAVLVLRFLVLLADRNAGRQVRDPDRRVGRVDRLAAGPRRAKDVDAQIRFLDVDVDVFGLWQHRDGRRRGVNAPLRFGFGNALHAVNARLEFHPRVNAVALDRGLNFLVAAFFSIRDGQDFDAPALKPGIALIHLE